MKIVYQDSLEGIRPDQLQGFFQGWVNRPSPQTHWELLKGSDYVVIALDEETNRVVGFITAISDGVLSAYIPLLEVLRPYQKRGIGSELMRRMLRRLEGLYMIDLLCEPELEPFYRRFGMKSAFGMMIRNYERQAGR